MVFMLIFTFISARLHLHFTLSPSLSSQYLHNIFAFIFAFICSFAYTIFTHSITFSCPQPPSTTIPHPQALNRFYRFFPWRTPPIMPPPMGGGEPLTPTPINPRPPRFHTKGHLKRRGAAHLLHPPPSPPTKTHAYAPITPPSHQFHTNFIPQAATPSPTPPFTPPIPPTAIHTLTHLTHIGYTSSLTLERSHVGTHPPLEVSHSSNSPPNPTYPSNLQQLPPYLTPNPARLLTLIPPHFRFKHPFTLPRTLPSFYPNQSILEPFERD